MENHSQTDSKNEIFDFSPGVKGIYGKFWENIIYIPI